MADPKLAKDLCRLAPLASHAHNSPKELEQYFLEKISHKITKKISSQFSGNRVLFLLPITEKKGVTVLKSVLYWRKRPPVPVGNLFSRIYLEDDGLWVEFSLEMHEHTPECISFPLERHLPQLRAPHNPQPLPSLPPETHQLVFIDLEWVSCYKGAGENHQVELEQISEFSFYTEDCFYTSGDLKVAGNYLKRMHKKLLTKMGITPEEMVHRHQKGQSFPQEWDRVLSPLLDNSPKQHIAMLSFGTEDEKILQKALSPAQKEKVLFVDLSQHYAIFNFGQMALLNGMGVTFTHDFSSAMDVKALYLIHRVFSRCVTMEDSRNLQLSLQLHKMYLLCENPEEKAKLYQYFQRTLAESETEGLFRYATELASTLVEEGLFQSGDSGSL